MAVRRSGAHAGVHATGAGFAVGARFTLQFQRYVCQGERGAHRHLDPLTDHLGFLQAGVTGEDHMGGKSPHLR